MVEDKQPVLLQEGRLIDYTIVFIMVKRLLKPIKKWDAFKLGLIDEDGKALRKPETKKEKDAYTILDRMILKIKDLIGKHKLKVITAFLLLKDSVDLTTLSNDELIEYCDKRRVARQLYKELKENVSSNDLTMEDFWSFLTQEKIYEE